MLKYIILFISFIVIVFSGCNVSDKNKVYSGTIEYEYVPEYLSDTCFVGSQDFFSLVTVEAFYKKRDYRSAWTENKKVNSLADTLVHFIRNAAYFGLSANDYALREIEELLKLIKNNESDAVHLAQLDKLLTNSYFTIAYHLEKGRVDLKTNKKFERPQIADSNYIFLLEKSLLNNNIIEELEALDSKNSQYTFLKKALKNRLDMKLNRFAESAAMESNLDKEILVLSINMERWRQEKELSDTYIFINIPSFDLKFVEKDSLILSSKVIVGKPTTPTPILNSFIECFTIYPYWTVPRSIATKELLPRIQKDPQLLNRQFYQVLDTKGNILDPHSIDWNTVSVRNFPYILRQTEGTYNALGILKFTFDNPYNVYLHDTNSRSLFKNDNRALSHGCIRIEKYSELAQILVKNDPDFKDPQVLQKMLTVQKRRTINLLDPVAIHTRYYTSEVVNDSLRIYKDVYKKDEKLIQSIYKNAFINNP